MRKLVLGLVLSSVFAAVASAPTLVLWDDRPAPQERKWERGAYPIGNGRLAMTTMGGTTNCVYQFNIDSLWTGDVTNHAAVIDAESDRLHAGCYQNAGELVVTLDLPEGAYPPSSARVAEGRAASAPPVIQNYRRALDLMTGEITQSYRLGEIEVKSCAFASVDDDALYLRYTFSQPVSGKLRLRDAHGKKCGVMDFHGELANGLAYAAKAVVQAKGDYSEKKGTFTNCTGFDVCLKAATSYNIKDTLNFGRRTGGPEGTAPADGADPKGAAASAPPVLRSSKTWSFDKALEAAKARQQKELGNVALVLEGTPDDVKALTTRARLERVRKGAHDPDLEALVFQYGRYLLLACSRPGSLPANLQGHWCNKNNPAWNSDYHTNINIQMNYWGADIANLSFTMGPLLDWTEATRANAERETRTAFPGSKGFAYRTAMDAFGGQGWRWNFAGAPWLTAQLFDHWRYTRDDAELRRIYPLMKGAAEFIFGELAAREDGKLVVKNGWSPEHGPREDGVAHDQQIVDELFKAIGEAQAELKDDPDFAKLIASTRARLLGPQIGKWGQLQEWAVDRDVQGDTHRHTSHLFAVYPGTTISPAETPEFAKAAAVALAGRAMKADALRSWTWPWRAALWSRLGDGEKAGAMVEGLLAHNMHDNLWAVHPPFQMDGNFGIVGAIAEMLVNKTIPARWAKGSVTGLRLRGGADYSWTWPAEGAALQGGPKGAAPVVDDGHDEAYTRKHPIDEPVKRNDRWTGAYERRHESRLAQIDHNRSHHYDLVLVGDSITHNWEKAGKDVMAKRFRGMKVLNTGFGGDRVETVHWRLANGELDGYQADFFCVMIGTNNRQDPSEEIVKGVKALVKLIERKHPESRILLCPILPRDDIHPPKVTPEVIARVRGANPALRAFAAEDPQVTLLDLDPLFMNADGTIRNELYLDRIHPNAAGYERWADALHTAMGR